MVSTYLSDIIILLVAAVVAVPLFQAARLGAVTGFLIAGMIVGPSVLGLIDNVDEISRLAEIGVVLLLFVIGIELKPSRLWLMSRLVFGLGTLQVLVTGALLGLLTHYLFGVSAEAAFLIGPALALSSTAFVLQLLSEKKALNTVYGRTAFAILLLQDLAVVPLLALIPLLVMPEVTDSKEIGFALLESLLILGLVILVGRYFLHPLLHRVALSGSPEIFTATAVLIVLGTALVTERIGLSMAMGAFIAGLLISDSAYRHQILAEIQPFRGLLLGLFFVSMGMSLNLSYFFEAPLVSLGIVAGLLLVKASVLWSMAYFFGFKGKVGLAIAVVLAQSGEFAMVLFALAFQSSLLTEGLFQQLLLIVLLSMLITPVLAQLADQLLKGKQNGEPEALIPVIRSPIVIAGFGRVGHRIGDVLTLAGQQFVALDVDSSLVEKHRANGYPVFYGDVSHPEVLNAVGVSHARVAIVTLNDVKATEKVVTSLKQMYPEIRIFARGQGLTQCRELKRLGVTVAVSENLEASLELARVAMAEVGIETNTRETVLANYRRSYTAHMDEDTAPDIHKS